MKVRLLKPWANWSKGHVFPEMPGGQARTLIARGLAEEVRAEEIRTEAPPPGSPAGYADRQMRPARRARS